jgi:predicted nucleotidyltransferase
MITEVKQHQAELESLCRHYGVYRLELFGSAAAGNYGPDSDLDFLVEFQFPVTGYADRYFGLLESLQQLFGRPIDLISASSAKKNPYFQQSIEKTKALLYAA